MGTLACFNCMQWHMCDRKRRCSLFVPPRARQQRALTWSVPLSVTLGTSIAAALSWGAAYVRYKTRPEELVRYMSKGSGAGFGLKWLFPTAGLLPWGMLMGFGLTFGACSVVLPDLVDFNDHPWSDAEVYSVRTLKTQVCHKGGGAWLEIWVSMFVMRVGRGDRGRDLNATRLGVTVDTLLFFFPFASSM